MASRHQKFAARTLAVAKRVGGKQGRALGGAVMEMLQSVTRPSIGTRTLIDPQIGAIKDFLGAFSPSMVPFGVKTRMRKHAQVRFVAGAAKAPLLRGDVWFDTNSTELQALLNRVFIESGLYKRTLRTSLLAVDYGFSAHEQVWDVAKEFPVGWDVPKKGGGFNHTEKDFKNLFLPRRLKDLSPELVTLLRDRYGEYAGLIFANPGSLAFNEAQIRDILLANASNILPPNKSFVFTMDGEWQNFYGTGRLDSAYDPWYWQTLLYLICNRWFERKGDPPLVGYAPSNPAIADPGVDAEEYDPEDENESPVLLMSRALEKLRSTGNLALPSDPYFDDDGKPGSMRAYEVKELESKDAHPAFLAYAEHLDVKISRAYLVPDAIAASQKGLGTYGSLQVMADVYVDVQNDTLSQHVEQFDREVVQPFLRYNDIKDRATLRTGGITSSSKETIKSVFEKVLEADMLAEQAFGRIYPQSLTVMLDRELLARGAGVPFKRPDPDAPTPEPPQDPASAAAGAAAGASGPQKGPAKKAKAAAIHVKMTEAEYVAHKIPTLIRDGVRGKKITSEQAVAVAHEMYKIERSKARAKKATGG